MAQRISGYDRKERDLYETPEWVTEALLPYIPKNANIWEPCCASGKIAKVVKAVAASDLVTDYGATNVDFLQCEEACPHTNAIITNPPFGKEAEKFIRHAIKLYESIPHAFLAFLLPIDFDSAVSRRDIFDWQEDQKINFSMKLILTSRIVWFERTDGKKAAPSSNHAWFCFSRDHYHSAIIKYAHRNK